MGLIPIVRDTYILVVLLCDTCKRFSLNLLKYHIKNPWISAECLSMPTDNDPNSGIDPKYRSIKINLSVLGTIMKIPSWLCFSFHQF